MKLFDFECSKCGMIFECLINLNKDSDPKCPNCKTKSKRIIGNPKHHKHSSWSIVDEES